MREVSYQPHLEPCPYLPDAGEPRTAASMKVFGKERGPEFYEGALSCGNSLWLQGLPAQALLQLNRAFGSALTGEEEVLDKWPLPYSAAVWVMKTRNEEQFIGNPRRHFQHLATRMVEPRKELRTWRAWACWHLACLVFPDYPADEKQIEEEGIEEPTTGAIEGHLQRLGMSREVGWWREAEALAR